jgi:hypothetical protein
VLVDEMARFCVRAAFVSGMNLKIFGRVIYIVER